MKDLHKEWFKKAENDLLNVQNNLEASKIPADTVCFHCHQVAEKYLKGFLTYHNQEIEKTHNLLYLYNLCHQFDIDIEEIKEVLTELNIYSVAARYPFSTDEILEEDAKEAYQLAIKVKKYIISKIK